MREGFLLKSCGECEFRSRYPFASALFRQFYARQEDRDVACAEYGMAGEEFVSKSKDSISLADELERRSIRKPRLRLAFVAPRRKNPRSLSGFRSRLFAICARIAILFQQGHEEAFATALMGIEMLCKERFRSQYVANATHVLLVF